MAGRQAKTLNQAQINTVLTYLTTTRHPVRDRVMFLLSVKAGLRAKEIASVTWSMVMDAGGCMGDALHLEDRASKMKSGRIIPLNRELRSALGELHGLRRAPADNPIIQSERGRGMSAATVAQWFHHLYRKLGFLGCSSHSGRRTFITSAARKIGQCGGSLRDVQMLAGHRSLQVTAMYIEGDVEAKRRVVNML